MASTFKRKQKTSIDDGAGISTASSGGASSSSMLGLKGTKPWTGGTTLTSFGLRDMDGILGGGQPMGTCILLEEDRWTQSLAGSLVRYWCAEAISQHQHLMIPTVENPEEDKIGMGGFGLVENINNEGQHSAKGALKTDVTILLQNLPRNLHWDKQKAQSSQSHEEQSSSSKLMETLAEDEEDDEADDAAETEAGLKIAWQYRKDVQRERLGHDAIKTPTSTSRSSASDVYCHSYDLSGRLDEQESLEKSSSTEPVQCCDSPKVCQHSRACGFRLYQRLLTRLQQTLSEQPRKVVRLLLYHRDPETLCIALPLLLAQIRRKHMPVVVLISVQPWTSSRPKSLLPLRRASDVVLQAEGFAARSMYPPPAEFRHLHGLLLIRKVATVTAATAIDGGHYADLTMSKRPPANIYGLKRDRRKLNIPLLHIPPEDHTEGGGSVGGGGVRSGAGRPPAGKQSSSGCGSGTGNSLLEF